MPQILKLDSERGIASARVTNEQYYTDTQDITDLHVLSRSRTRSDGRTHFGRVQVHFSIFGYLKIWKKSGKLLEACDVSMPPFEFATHAMWTDIPVAVKWYLDAHGMDFLGGCHAASHAVLSALPASVLCDRGDLGCECYDPLMTRAKPFRVMIFDNKEGGVGVSAAAFERSREVYTRALHILEGCSCGFGCPSCCHDPHCGSYNLVLDKPAAIIILRCVIGLSPPGIAAYTASSATEI
jgi:DEAD/DEAH box helicase domain-containing protein